MLTLDLPPSVENQIIQNAHAQDLSISQYIQNLLPFVQRPRDPKVMQSAQGILAGRLEEALAFQQQLRDEWD